MGKEVGRRKCEEREDGDGNGNGNGNVDVQEP